MTLINVFRSLSASNQAAFVVRDLIGADVHAFACHKEITFYHCEKLIQNY